MKRSLTPRHIEVLTLAAGGHGIKASASAMGLSTDTVASYRKAVLSRMAASNIAHAVAIAVRDKLINT